MPTTNNDNLTYEDKSPDIKYTLYREFKHDSNSRQEK